jgi:hypothetical protein
MNDGRHTPKEKPAIDPLSRREFLGQGVRCGFALGAASLGTSRLWVPGTPDQVDEALGTDGLMLRARGMQRTQMLTLSNAAITAQWSVDAGRLRVVRLAEPNGATLDVPRDAFTVILGGDEPLRASDLHVVGAPRIEAIAARSGASRLAERLPGRQVAVVLEDYAKRLRVEWRAELRDGSRYIRQEITLRPLTRDLDIRQLVLVDLPGAGASVNGTVKGSPLIIDRWFASVEHPLATSEVKGGRARRRSRVSCRCAWARRSRCHRSSARRDRTAPARFSRVRRARARASLSPFLHYNSWYDLGYFSKFNEPEALAVIARSARSSAKARGRARLVSVRRRLG